MKKYINLKNHTSYSLLKGYGDIKDHINEVKSKGHEGICVTDIHTLRGSIDLYKTSKNRIIDKESNKKAK